MTALARLRQSIRQALCKHTWRPTLFQALVPGTSYECTKCGKMEQRP